MQQRSVAGVRGGQRWDRVRRPLWALCPSALWLITLWAVPARGEPSAPPPPDEPFTWTAPPGCPTLTDVQPILDAVVADDLRETMRDTQVSVVIEPAGDAYRATVTVTREGYAGERVVDGARCAEVARSALIVVSVALADAQVAVVDEGAPRPHQGTQPPPSQDPATRVEPAHASETSPPGWAVTLDLGVISGMGDTPLVPHVATGFLFARHAWLMAGARVSTAPYVPVRHAGERVARAATVTLAPVLCALPRVGETARMGICAGLEVGALLSHGIGLDTNLKRVRAYGSVRLSPTFTVGARTGLRCSLDAELRITRPVFAVEGLGPVGRVRDVGVGATCGILFFPR